MIISQGDGLPAKEEPTMYERHYTYFIRRYGDNWLGRWLARRDAQYMTRNGIVI